MGKLLVYRVFCPSVTSFLLMPTFVCDHAYVDRPLYSDIALWATDWPLAIVSALLVNVDITNMS